MRSRRPLLLAPLAVLWACVEAPPIPPPETSRAVQEGHRLFLAKCARCHDPVQPAEHLAIQWPPLLENCGARAGLDAGEKADVLAYLQQYSQ